MRIGIVGGLDRNEGVLQRMAAEAGHLVEVHTGRVSSGAHSSAIKALVERSDVLVVVTDVNSHAGVWAARKAAQKRGRRTFLIRKFGPSALASLLQSLAA